MKDVIKLKENLNFVLLSLKAKENEIKEMEVRIPELERKPHIKPVNCDVCGYEAISMISLETHMNEVHMIEPLRHSDKSDSLLLKPPSQMREMDRQSLHPPQQVQAIFSLPCLLTHQRLLSLLHARSSVPTLTEKILLTTSFLLQE